jgi:predicted nucleotidyltransferase
LNRGRSIAVSPNREVVFSSPEDVILKKLDFFQQGGSEKHLRDIAGMLNQRKIPIDRDYILNWVRKLHLEEAWGRFNERLSAGGNLPN